MIRSITQITHHWWMGVKICSLCNQPLHLYFITISDSKKQRLQLEK